MAQLVKDPPAMQETWLPSLGWEDPLEKGKATHSRILAWRIHHLNSPWDHKELNMTEQKKKERNYNNLSIKFWQLFLSDHQKKKKRKFFGCFCLKLMINIKKKMNTLFSSVIAVFLMMET